MEHPDKIKRQYDKRYKRSTEESRMHHLKSSYRISVEDFNITIKNQNFNCKICKIRLKPGRESHIDHDHSTGEIRGILCRNCNQGLGFFKDNSELLLKASEYVRLLVVQPAVEYPLALSSNLEIKNDK